MRFFDLEAEADDDEDEDDLVGEDGYEEAAAEVAGGEGASGTSGAHHRLLNSIKVNGD
jgi:hypothetical protein